MTVNSDSSHSHQATIRYLLATTSTESTVKRAEADEKANNSLDDTDGCHLLHMVASYVERSHRGQTTTINDSVLSLELRGCIIGVTAEELSRAGRGCEMGCGYVSEKQAIGTCRIRYRRGLW